MTSLRKVAFVTGSGKRRIGNVIALEAARRGYDIALHFRSSKADAEETASEISALGAQVDCFSADLEDSQQTITLCREVAERFGRVDLLATCASIWEEQRLEDVTPEDLIRNFMVNTAATFLCCQHIGALMVSQPEGGSIVTFGDWAVERPYSNYAAYFASKGSIEAMTRMFANELATRNPNVRVNCIHPGPAMVPESLGEKQRESIIRHSLVRRLGTPEAIARAVFHFAENDYVTGTALAIDGGRTASNR